MKFSIDLQFTYLLVSAAELKTVNSNDSLNTTSNVFMNEQKNRKKLEKKSNFSRKSLPNSHFTMLEKSRIPRFLNLRDGTGIGIGSGFFEIRYRYRDRPFSFGTGSGSRSRGIFPNISGSRTALTYNQR